MKKAFLLLCTLLLVLGCALPLAAYHLTRAVLGPAVSTVRLPLSSPESTASAPEISAAYAGDADRFLIQDASTGQVLELSRREYLIGAVAAEMPVSWPDEALKAQAVAAHSYALYCRDHTAPDSIGWLTADPARRQGCLTDPVLRSYWGTAYETNYARLAALVDEVEHTVLLCDGAPACASYFAISNGRTEASENVWGTALPYLVSVDSSTDTAADNSHLFQPLHLRRLAERTDKIMQAVALVQLAERHRRCADLLEYDRDRALVTVKICDRERNTLAFCADTQDDELTRLCLAGNVRCLDHHQLGVCVQRLLFQNLIHSLSYLLAIVASNILHYTVSL